jgi:integrase
VSAGVIRAPSWRAHRRATLSRVLDLADLVHDYLDHQDRRGASRVDLASFARAWVLAPERGLLGVDLSRMDAEDCLAWSEGQRLAGLAASTRHRNLRLLSSLLAHAVRLGALARNPVRDIDPGDWPDRDSDGPDRAELEMLSPAQVAAVLTDWRVPLWAQRYFAALYALGVRPAEGAGLSVGDWDPDAQTVVVRGQWHAKTHRMAGTKTRRARVIPVHPALARRLEDGLRDAAKIAGRDLRPGDPLTPHPIARQLRRWNSRTALRYWHDALDALGIVHPAGGPRRLVALRHCFVTHLLEAGADPLAVQACTHAVQRRRDSAMWRYAHGPLLARKRAAIALLPMPA